MTFPLDSISLITSTITVVLSYFRDKCLYCYKYMYFNVSEAYLVLLFTFKNLFLSHSCNCFYISPASYNSVQQKFIGLCMLMLC